MKCIQLPAEPHLRVQFIRDHYETLIMKLAEAGFTSCMAKGIPEGFIDPRYAAAYLLKSGWMRFLPESQTLLVIQADGCYVEASEGDICVSMSRIMHYLGRQAGFGRFFVDLTPGRLIQTIRDVATGRQF